MKADKFPQVEVWGWLMELAGEGAPASGAGMEGLCSKQVGQVAAEALIHDPCQVHSDLCCILLVNR